jgi:intein/homing endonuclease
MASEPELAYLAGLIDGEGCIRIEKSGGRYRETPHTPTVCVTNANPTLIMWVYNKFGGHLYLKKNRTCWDIYWLGKKAVEILKEVYPYLIAKKEQTELVFAYRELIGKPGKRLSPDNIEKRKAIVEAMSILKKNSQILMKEEVIT